MNTQDLKKYIDKVLGNNIRCLLPSYWWKRLFNQVVDRVDEVEQSTSQLIDSKVEEVKMPIVESVDELEKLELAKGGVAAVEKTGESATVKISDCYLSANSKEDWGKYTIVKGVEEKDNVIIDKDTSVLFTASKGMVAKDALQIDTHSGIFYYRKWIDYEAYVTSLEEVNKALSSGKYRAVQCLNAPDDYFTFYSKKSQPSLYIKGDSWEKLSNEYVVSSEEELNALSVENGTIARVVREIGPPAVKVSDCYLTNNTDNYANEWDKFTVIKKIEETDMNAESSNILYICALNESFTKDAIGVGYDNGVRCYIRIVDGVESPVSLDIVNDLLATGNYRLVIQAIAGRFDSYFTFYTEVAKDVSDAYIKGETWTRLLKEGDVTGGGEDKTLTFYAPIDDVSLSDAEKQHNAESYQKVAEGFESDTYYDIKVLLSTFQLVALDVIKTINPANDNGRLKLTFGGVGSGIDLQMLTVTSDGSATITIEGIEESGVELRDLYIYENYDGTLTELTEEQKAWNLETLELAKQGKAIVRTTHHGYTFILELFNEDNDYQFGYTQFSPSGGVAISVGVTEDGLSGIKIEESHFDSELSTTSTNAIQNKVVKAYVDTEVAKKVDKVSGKGLSTEDFTTLLKTKLEGLENYDDTTLANAISSLETRLNTLVSGDTSTAIESFNEVIAFLEDLTDTQDLSSIIASIEQQINAKQDKINDLEDIRSGASLGKTSLQEHQDVSYLATKEELQNVVDDILENEEVYAAAVNDLNNRVTTTDTLLATETTNREALQTEVQTINTNILENEEVIAATLVDLNSQIASLNAIIAELTTRIETLENA